jgi:hypothetical protein
MIWTNQSREDRDTIIRQRIASGQFEVTWLPITSAAKGHTAIFQVMADALKMDGVRINVSATLEQQIADKIGASLLTPKLADLRWMQRGTSLAPITRPIVMDTASMVTQSAAIDKAVAAKGGPSGIIATVGKDWVISNQLPKHPGKGENYGDHFEGQTWGNAKWESAVTPPFRVVQGQGWFHDPTHVDYSQVCVLVRRDCVVDGVSRDIRDVMADPELAWLLSHDGKLSITRQPGVPEQDPQGVSPANISGSDPFLMARRQSGQGDQVMGMVAGAAIGMGIGAAFFGIPGAVVGGIIGTILGKLQSSI